MIASTTTELAQTRNKLVRKNSKKKDTACTLLRYVELRCATKLFAPWLRVLILRQQNVFVPVLDISLSSSSLFSHHFQFIFLFHLFKLSELVELLKLLETHQYFDLLFPSKVWQLDLFVIVSTLLHSSVLFLIAARRLCCVSRCPCLRKPMSILATIRGAVLAP